jgi:hypothetical protein
MTRPNILLLQLEIIPDCPPHMGMCLFIDDLRRQGAHCDTYIIQVDRFTEIFNVIKKGDYQLICVDSVFTIDMINHLREDFPDIPILAGGINSLALLMHSNVQYVVFGPGREAVSSFIQQYFGPGDFSRVPNLFFKNNGHIGYSGKTIHWDLKRELFPYMPFLDWQYIGPGRSPDANRSDVSIVAETGCPYAHSTVSSHDIKIRDTLGEIGYSVSDSALQRLNEIFNRHRHGCSFCIFQYQEHTHATPEQATELLLRQVLHLHSAHNVTSFQIQSENPLPFLNSFLLMLIDRGIPFHKISIRTRPDLLLRHQDKLIQALELARENNFCLSVEQIGFESFCRDDLQKFNKNTTVELNLEVLNLLRTVKDKYGPHVVNNTGHGIILFHPWTTLESITETVKIMALYPDIFPSFFTGNLILYSEFIPIFQEIRKENLMRKSEYYYGYEHIIKDPAANKAFELYRILLACFQGNISIQGYLTGLEMIENNFSVDEILAKVFYLVPVPESGSEQ